MILGLDLDGVLYPWHQAVYTYYRIYRDYKDTFYEFWTKFYKTIPESTFEYLCSLEDLYYKFAPTSQETSMINRLAEKHTIYYITSRPPIAQVVTEKYLRNFKYPYRDNLVYTKDKGRACRYYGVDVLFDDLPHNLESISKSTIGVLVNQPYNMDYQANIRINSIMEIERLLNHVRR